MNVFDLVAKLTLDSSDYNKGLGDGKEKAAGFGQQLAQVLGKGGAIAGAAIGAVGSAAAALGTKLVGATGEIASYGDNIDKMSQKMGLSAEAYQEWDAIMQHSGTTIDTMQAGMKTLANAVESGNKAFERLGLSADDIAGMSQEELFAATIESLQNVQNETERTYLAGQLLGRGATELGALLNTSAKDTEAMRKRVHELGGVLSDDAVKAAAAYQDSLQDMQTAFAGLTRTATAEFMPGMQSVIDGLANIFSGDFDKGLEQITVGVEGLLDTIEAMLPELLDKGSKIVTVLLNAIISNLPMLLTGSAEIITQIAIGLIEHLPDIIEAGLEVIIALSDGIADNLPELLPTIIDVVVKIVETLISNAPKMLAAAAKLIGKLIEGIALMYAQLIETAGNIVAKIIDGIRDKFGKIVETGKEIINKVKEGVTAVIDGAKQWGKDLIQNFIDGIMQMWEKLKSTVGKVAGVIGDLIGFSEPKEGPLSNFHTFAPDMMELYAKGIRENKWRVLDEIDKLAGDMALQTEVKPGKGSQQTHESTGFSSIQTVVQVDGRTIARATNTVNRNHAVAMSN